MTERDPRRSREQKLKDLARLGLPALPNTFADAMPSSRVLRDYDQLEGTAVRVAGRIMTERVMGKAAFAHIQDASGRIQLYVKLDVVGPKLFEYFKLLDLGDIIGAEGEVFKTRTGEVSVQVTALVLLAKSYQPLPDKYHGFTDVEARYRRRYVDLIANDEARDRFIKRSQIVREMRRYLDDRGFLEVETPTLQPLYGGAAATPFVTRYNALDMDAYLRIATELYLKRLIVGGLERVYEIGKDFRNENFSRKHSPEFTMMELYQAYADYDDIMRLLEDMTSTVARNVIGSPRVTYGEWDIDFTPPWTRRRIRDVVFETTGIDLDESPRREGVLAAARSSDVDVDSDASVGKIVEEIVSQLVEPHLIQPTILYDFPVDFPGSLLAKRRVDNPEMTERFEAYVAGMEFANAFTELNDPFDQLARMQESARLTGEEYAAVDEDFILALEYGMPPTGGIGVGIDRVVMVMTNTPQIRETILFPLLRPARDSTDYPESRE